MINRLFIAKSDSPVIATAIHDGHYMDPEFLALLNLQEHERMREEDPYTAYMAQLPVNQVFVNVSRFQTDLNRVREKAIYLQPEDAWGLTVWNTIPPDDIIQKAQQFYDDFYHHINNLLAETIEAFGSFLVLDIHSYNHRREQPDIPAAKEANPEINVGTANNQPRWEPLCQEFIHLLSQTTIGGKQPDVRENIKFKGGAFSQWITQHYGQYGCVLSVEFKKTFMDEWTGRADIAHLNNINNALRSSLQPMVEKLNQM